MEEVGGGWGGRLLAHCVFVYRKNQTVTLADFGLLPL